jgi:hypothetical protein
VPAATQVLPASDDTFINGGNPANNNGASASIFTGTDGHGGVMRGLIRFGMPTGLAGRATVTNVRLSMTLQALGNGSVGAGAIERLQAVTQPFLQGNGVGNVSSAFTVGEACGGPIVGATWIQSNCGTSTNWTTAGGAVTAQVSGEVDTTGLPPGSTVVWDSASSTRMNADVQGWIDSGTNFGWRITSSTESMVAMAQRFDSSESGAPPHLAITYSCRPGFVASGNACVPAPAVPATGRWILTLLALVLSGIAFAALGFRRRDGVATSRALIP